MGYSDWPVRRISNRPGGVFTSTANRKFVVHTTETRGLPNYEWPPHATYNPATDEGWVHVNPDRSAYALRSPGGGRSPNYQGGYVYQLEVIAYARDVPNKTDDWYRNLGRTIREICDTEKIPLRFHPKGFSGSGTYGENGRNRISWLDYRSFTGILGHQHVPFNTHWDPGALDTSRLTTFMHFDQEEDTMTPEQEAKLDLILEALGPVRRWNDWSGNARQSTQGIIDGSWWPMFAGRPLVWHLVDAADAADSTDLDAVAAEIEAKLRELPDELLDRLYQRLAPGPR